LCEVGAELLYANLVATPKRDSIELQAEAAWSEFDNEMLIGS
jgi:hypothetical protein